MIKKILNTAKGLLKGISYVLVALGLILALIVFVIQDYANNGFTKCFTRDVVSWGRNFAKEIKTDVKFIKSDIKKAGNDKKSIEPVLQRFLNQKSIDEKLQKELQSISEYTIDDPFMVVNPYGVSPLSALMCFSTESPSVVTVSICGNDEGESIVHIFNKQGFTKEHILPIYGLYPDNNNKVIVKIKNESGIEKIKEVEILTEPIDAIFNNINLVIHSNDHKKYQPGLNFTYGALNGLGLKMAFDINGNIRWCFNDFGNADPTNYVDGKCVYRTFGGYSVGGAIITKESFLGRIEAMYYVPNGVHHEMFLTDSETMIVGTNHIETVQDCAVEIDLNTGKVVRNIDFRDLLPRARYVGSYHHKKDDWAHINSVVKVNGDYIFSSNFQSAVARSTSDGAIKWLLSDPQGYPTYWKERLLKPIGEGFEYPYNQHAIEILPDYDNNPYTIDLLLFDNGNSRNVMSNALQNKISVSNEAQLYSRLVHYRINEHDMTVECVWEYGKERSELYSPTRGDADLMPNGNILGCFTTDGVPKDDKRYCETIYCEVDRNGTVVWECYATNNKEVNRYIDYRVERIPIYNSEKGYVNMFEESKNFVSKEVWEKYGLQSK